MNYKYGNWFCKPANEAEAKEIIKRALESGARKDETIGNLGWSSYGAWGVYNGRTFTQRVDFYLEQGATEYTIEELRKKFPLPGEKVAKQWRGLEDGLPPVGTVCIGKHEDVNNGSPCTVEILKHNKNGIGCAVFWIDAPNGEGNLFWCSNLLPLRTEQEQWVDAAAIFAHKHAVLTPEQSKHAAYAMYQALTSGQLKAPVVER